jgi:glutamine amidotransferase
MNVTIVDYNSGNISSVINSFNEVAKDKVNIKVTSDLNKIKLSDKIVLPGQGSFKSCIDALNNIDGLVDALNEFVIINKKPLLESVLDYKCLQTLVMKKQKPKDLAGFQARYQRLIIKMENTNSLILVGIKLI